jgi:chromate transport protein ChrA
MSRLFNLQHALMGAMVMALSVAVGNLTAGWEAAGRAGAVQACASFLVIGANTAFSQRLHRCCGLVLAVIGPTAVAVLVASVFHTVSDTPNLIVTLAIVAISAAVNFGVLTMVQERFGTIQPVALARRAWARVRAR